MNRLSRASLAGLWLLAAPAAAFAGSVLQLFATRDVSEHHYTGLGTRGWARLVVPLYQAAALPAPEPLRARF